MVSVFIGPDFIPYYERWPLRLVDIGASGGLNEPWQRLDNHLCVIGFEPHSTSVLRITTQQDKTRQDKTKFLQVGLSDKQGVGNFYRTREPNVSSLLRPNWPFLSKFSPATKAFEVLQTLPLHFDTLDHQLEEQKVADVDFVKLDTQGSELLVLEGARNTITNSVFGLEVEVSFVERYCDQPHFSDVDQFLRRLGFCLFDLNPHYWKRTTGRLYGHRKGQLIYAEALFFRATEEFYQLLGRVPDHDFKKSKVLKAISICLLYGYLDYAMEVFSAGEELFTKTERRAFHDCLGRGVPLSARIPYFRGRLRLANALSRLSAVLSPKQRHRSKLGNV